MSGLDHPDFPHKEGNTLVVRLDESFSPSTQREMTLHLRIQRRFDPITFSPVVLVKVAETGETLVAKFFDRRFNPDYRKNQAYEDWNSAREDAFRSLVSSGEGAKFLQYLYDDDDSDILEDWTPAQEELSAQDDFKGHFENEVRTYRALEWLQGQNVAKMLGTVTFRISEADNENDQQFFDVRGVLLEHIEGFNLSEMTSHTSQDAWKDIIEEAMSIANAAGDLGVINRDLSVYHFIVRSFKTGDNLRYQPVMFDFGHTGHREDYDTLEEWMAAKCTRDEEGAIGVIMARRVARAGGLYEYKRSNRYGVFKMDEPGLRDRVWHPPPGCFEWRFPASVKTEC